MVVNKIFSIFPALLIRLFGLTDLREDKQFFMDHPGACTISTAQVFCNANTFFHACLHIIIVEKYLQNFHEMAK